MSLTSNKQKPWTNPSVLALAGERDPVEVITERARTLVLDAAQAGWTGPPFDLFKLSSHLRIQVIPREDIQDARSIPVGSGKIQIEFNPNRPAYRIRYSIAHEFAHTLFPDCAQQVRNRMRHEEMEGDDWQLEMLCNIGASEILMPIGSFSQLKEESVSIENLISLAEKFEVSFEAVLIRYARLTEKVCAMFCASRVVGEHTSHGRYVVNYAFSSRSWGQKLVSGSLLPRETTLSDCTAIGFTAKAEEEWPGIEGKVFVECLGIPPYPNQIYPRVIGLIKPSRKQNTSLGRLMYVIGDATKPIGKGHRIIAHVVNDKASLWGGGFANVVRKKWPSVQEDFRAWARKAPGNFSLGHIHITAVDDLLSFAHMISQHGYGPSPTPGIRYMALKICLDQLADVAKERRSSVHMPRIGCGEARGRWEIVEELIYATLCAGGVDVTVYDLPQYRKATQPSPGLFAHQTS